MDNDLVGGNDSKDDESGGAKSLSTSLDMAKLDEVAESQKSVGNLVAGLGDKMEGLVAAMEMGQKNVGSLVVGLGEKLDDLAVASEGRKESVGNVVSDIGHKVDVLGDKLEGVVSQVLQRLEVMSAPQQSLGDNENASSSSKVEELEAECVTLKQKVSSLESEVKSMEAMMKSESDRYQAELKAKEDVVGSMRVELREQAANAEAGGGGNDEELEGELRAVKEDLAKERADKKALRKAAKGLQATVADLEAKLKELKSTREAEKEAWRAKEKEREETTAKVEAQKVASDPSSTSSPPTPPTSHVKSSDCGESCSSCVTATTPGKFLPPSSPAINSGWTKELDNHPLPPYGLSSPVILHLLSSWTSDEQKVKYLKTYLQCLTDITKPIPKTFPKGLTLLGMSKEVKDGFLTLVVPMLRGREDGVKVEAYSRIGEKDDDDDEDDDDEIGGRGDEVVYDLKLKVIVSNVAGVQAHQQQQQRQQQQQQPLQVGDRKPSAGVTASAAPAKSSQPNNLADRIKMRLDLARKASSAESGGAANTGI